MTAAPPISADQIRADVAHVASGRSCTPWSAARSSTYATALTPCWTRTDPRPGGGGVKSLERCGTRGCGSHAQKLTGFRIGGVRE